MSTSDKCSERKQQKETMPEGHSTTHKKEGTKDDALRFPEEGPLLTRPTGRPMEDPNRNLLLRGP